MLSVGLDRRSPARPAAARETPSSDLRQLPTRPDAKIDVANAASVAWIWHFLEVREHHGMGSVLYCGISGREGCAG
jgi:hypothetical protein